MDYFAYRHGVYHAEEVSLATIADAVGTPFYCYSDATLRRHVQVLREAFSTRPVRICFAVKANHNLAVLATLAQLGVGADVVSEGEIRLSRAAGMAADHIVFSGVGKSKSEMAMALSEGIFQFNAESAEEVRALAEVAGSLGVRAPLALRVNPDVTADTHAKISTGHKESKFGIAFAQARALYQEAQASPHLSVQGISMHIGSQITSLTPFAEACGRLAVFVRTLRSEGIAITTIDVGGGLGVPYEASATPPTPEAYARVVLDALKDTEGTLLCEPGRLLVGNAGVLVASTLYTKTSGDKRFLIVDAGMNDLIRPAMYDAYHDIYPACEGGRLEPHDVVGPVCESSDVFALARPLPCMKSGDLVVFRTAGAYGAVMSGTYNGRLLIPEVMVQGSHFAVTRARQTYAALIGSYALPPWIAPTTLPSAQSPVPANG